MSETLASKYQPLEMDDAECVAVLESLRRKRASKHGEHPTFPEHRRELAALSHAIEALKG